MRHTGVVVRLERLSVVANSAMNRDLGLGGRAAVRLPFRYLGADPSAGPNYTGQPAVHSYYEPAQPQ